MPAPLDEQIRRKVIQQWFNGLPRDKIAEDNNIGAGTVPSIISNYKVGLETLDFDSIRQLALEIRKQGLNWSDLGSHYRRTIDYTTTLSKIRGQQKKKLNRS
jgi:hypothetical protein